MSVDHAAPTHPTLLALTRARQAVASAGGRDPIFLSPTEQAAALTALVALSAQVAELQARVTHAALPSGVDDGTGTHDVTPWIAGALRLGHPQARAATRLARRLDACPRVAAALAAGVMTLPQAEAVTRAVDVLPADLDPALVAEAEAHLVDLATTHGPQELRILGRRILDVVAPDVVEAAEARALEDEERTAAEKTRLSLRSRHDGTTTISGIIPDLVALRLATYLHAFTNPRRSSRHDPDLAQAGAEKPFLTAPRTLGQAFCDLVERIDPQALPAHGATTTELVVTMSLDALHRDLAVATVLGPQGATPISAAAARRLACNAGIIPAVLGTRSEVLDLGRTARFASRPQRRALMLTQSLCQAEHCDRPAPWCEAHHLDPWSHGGRTDLALLALLCSQHHHQVHDTSYTHERLPDGTIRFTRRC